MYELYQALFAVDQSSLIVVMVLCSWAAFIVRSMLPHPLLLMLVYPGFVIIALAADAALGSVGLQPTSDKLINLAFATGVGTSGAFTAFAALYWLLSQRSH
ncbi:MAG TPA: hypothetical protein VNK52_05575 [Hyphomicrobiaceae bacterium]|nr:hypothetical protein [Hyphomicrobiaceae bacterium]